MEELFEGGLGSGVIPIFDWQGPNRTGVYAQGVHPMGMKRDPLFTKTITNSYPHLGTMVGTDETTVTSGVRWSVVAT